MNKFDKEFSDFSFVGDMIMCQTNGFLIYARVDSNDDMGPPWVEHDGHGPVSDWTDRLPRPGERVLATDRYHHRYYDWDAAIAKALEEGWDAPPYRQGTPMEQAERAVKRDFKHMKAWCDNEWFWCTITLSVYRGTVLLDEYAAMESGLPCNDGDNSHLTEAANELLDEAIAAGNKIMNEILADWPLPESETHVQPRTF